MATLTSTGNVNLTTSTNWSPDQIPQAGDTLIIKGHTLLFDIDFVAESITWDTISGRFEISGTTRTITATNGFFLSGTNNLLGNKLCNTNVIAGMLITFIGRWSITASNTTAGNRIIDLNGGTLNFYAKDSNPQNELYNAAQSVQIASVSGSATILNTIGYFTISANCFRLVSLNGSSPNGSSWNHSNLGSTSSINVSSGQTLISLQAVSTVNFVGDISTSGAGILISATSGSGIFNYTGNISGSIQRIFSVGTGSCTFNFTGNYQSTNSTAFFIAGNGSSSVLNIQNQTISILATSTFYVDGCLFNLSNTTINNSGRILISNTTIVSTNTIINQTSQDAMVYTASSSLNGKILPFQLNAPTLPSTQNVAGGVTYGYTGFLQTGTGLILDPAILAAAISANIPDIIDGVHEADLRDYEDTNHSLAWTLKKLRQANPTIEFEVTDDITPEVGRFSVNLTGYTNDSFSHTVLYMDAESNLPYDDSPIISYTQEDEYGIIEIEEPFSEPPEVGSVGFINPAIHVHSIEAIQSGLAKEDTLTTGITNILDGIAEIPTSLDQETIDAIREGLAEQETLEIGIISILEGIGEIDVDFTPILDRLPDALENGRIKASLSSTQIGNIQSGLALQSTSEQILTGVLALNSNDRGEFF